MEASNGSRRKLVRRLAGRLGIALGLGLVLWLAWTGFHLIDLVGLAGEFNQMQEINLRYDWAGASHRLAKDVNAIQGAVQPLFLAARLIPDQTYLGYLTRQYELFLGFSADLANCAEALAVQGRPILDLMKDDTSTPGIDEVLSVIDPKEESWAAANAWYQAASEKRAVLDVTVLPASMQKFYRKLDENFDLLGLGIKIIPELPALAGFSQPKTYLLIAQNNDELRASGGFISGIGTVNVTGGNLDQFALGDSYLIDDFSKHYPPPPSPIARFMLSGYWVPRDANWSPDFPTAAQKIAELYKVSTDQPTDGVIAFDQTALQCLLAVTGPVTLPSVNQPVSSENVQQFMRDAYAPEKFSANYQDWWLHRKDFMKDLGGKLINRILRLEGINQYVQITRLVIDLIHSGHMLVYLTEEPVQSALARVDLAGTIKFDETPAFMLVDSNIGFNKMDGVVQRSVDIQLDWSDPAGPLATVRITYTNPVIKEVACHHIASYGDGSYLDMQTRCYWDYWRLYLPAKSQLIEFSSPAIPPDWLLSHETVQNPVEVSEGEGGAAIIGGLVVVPVGQTREVLLKIRLPALKPNRLANGSLDYPLTFYKQPGLETLPLTLRIQLPAGVSQCSSQNKPSDPTGQPFSWSGQITATLQLHFCATGD